MRYKDSGWAGVGAVISGLSYLSPSGSLDLTIYWGRKLVPRRLATPTPEWISVKRVSEEMGVVPDLFTWGGLDFTCNASKRGIRFRE